MASIEQWEVWDGHERWSRDTVVPIGLFQLQSEWGPYHSNHSPHINTTLQTQLLHSLPEDVDSISL
jgi:hypothetical protein